MCQPEPLTESARLESSASSQCEALDACDSKISVSDATNDFVSPVDSSDRKGSGSSDHKQSGQRGSLFRLAIPLLLAVGIGIASFFVGPSTESNHENWKHVSAAQIASDVHQAETFLHVDTTGQIAEVATIELTTSDVDRNATSRVRRSLRSANVGEANAAIQAAQQISPDPKIEFKETQPALPPSADILTAIKDGDAEFFHLHMFDSCYEDGDVIQVSVGGQVYATVPLTHAGSTISIPLQSGMTPIAIRGIRDGGGGITIQFTSSQGDYFCRAMDVGEEYHLGVVVP